jgi:hypothetical protein
MAARRRIGSDTVTTAPAEQLSGLRELYAGPLAMRYLPMLNDPGLCSVLRAYADPQLRLDLVQLSEEIPAMLERLAALPQAVGHGDACPQNLLIPAEAPNTVVAIDLSWQHPEAIGFDLGQLLIGLAHTGDLPRRRTPRLARRPVGRLRRWAADGALRHRYRRCPLRFRCVHGDPQCLHVATVGSAARSTRP